MSIDLESLAKVLCKGCPIAKDINFLELTGYKWSIEHCTFNCKNKILYNNYATKKEEIRNGYDDC